MRKLFLIVGGVVFLAVAYFGVTRAHWRNWWVWDMADPNRVIDLDKYVPQEAVQTRPPAPLEMAALSERTLSEDAVQELQTLARDTQSFLFLVSHGNRLQFSYYAEGIGPETLLDSYSIHKGLLALAFGYTVDQGYLESIDTLASEYIPEWQNDPRRDITIRQLLNNESGLRRFEYATTPYNPVLDFFIGRNLEELTFSFPLDFAPGSAFEFNHVNSQVLHFVLVRITGKSYADILSEYLWKPLGNEQARVALDHQGSAARTICRFLSTTPNWSRIGMLLNNRGRFRDRQIISAA